MDFDIVCLRAQVVEAFEGLWHEPYREIIPEATNAYAPVLVG